MQQNGMACARRAIRSLFVVVAAAILVALHLQYAIYDRPRLREGAVDSLISAARQKASLRVQGKPPGSTTELSGTLGPLIQSGASLW